MLEYTEADLAEAAKLAPTLNSKAHERIARALANRERVGALKEWARHDNVTPDELRQLVAMVERGELAEVQRG